MIAALLLALLQGTGAPTPQAALAGLRELAELDLPAELLPRGRALTAEGGLLARSGEARALVARALFEAGEEEEALRLLDADLPETERAWVELERAALLLERDDLAGAARLLRPAVGSPQPVRWPELPEAWILLARVEARAGETALAARLARGFLERAPYSPQATGAWHLLAQDALARRDAETAAKYLERAKEMERWTGLLRARRLQVRLHPDEPLPRLGLALAWMDAGAFDRARPLLEDLVRRHPDFARGWFHLGETLRAAGDLGAAAGAWRRALDADPDMHLARFNLAVAALVAGRAEEAREELERLEAAPEAEADPRLAALHLNLARLDLAQGLGERALQRYARYRELGGREPLEPPRGE